MTALALLLSACAGLAQATPTPAAKGTPAGRQTAAVVVSVSPVQQGAISSVLTYSAAVQAHDQVSIVPKAQGRLNSVNVEVGSVVKAGDIVAEQEHATLDAQVQQAQANVASAQAKLTSVLAGGRPESVGAAQAAVASAQAKLNQAVEPPTQADLQAAQAAVAAAQVQLQTAQSNYDKLKNPTQDETVAARAAVVSAKAALDVAQGNYDKVAWRPDIQSRPEALALQNATIAYQAALANYNIKVNPRPEDVKAIEDALASAQAAYNTAKAKLELLQAGATADDVAIAQSAVQAARNQLALAQSPYTDSDVKAAEATLAQAQAALAVAQSQRADANITSPLDGVVSQKLLSAGALASTGTPVVTITTTDAEIWLSVDEGRIGQLQSGLPAQITVPAYPGQTFQGQVATVSPTADSKSHTFPVRVVPAVQDGRLKPGMFAAVSVVTGQNPNAILVPIDGVVVQADGSTIAYVVTDGVARLHQLRLGMSDGKNHEVLSGLSVGDEVVTAGQSSLRDGTTVRISGSQAATPGAGGTPGAGSTGSGQSRTKPQVTPTPGN